MTFLSYIIRTKKNKAFLFDKTRTKNSKLNRKIKPAIQISKKKLKQIRKKVKAFKQLCEKTLFDICVCKCKNFLD